MTKDEVRVTVVVHSAKVDERIIRRALARGLQAEGWQPTLPHEIVLVTPCESADDLLADLLKLREEQVDLPVKTLILDDPERVQELKKLVYKPALRH